MLIKAMNKSAARILKNTYGAHAQQKPRIELLQEAYGASVVEADFKLWCEEVKDRNPRYPISEYLKVVDSRLGSAVVDDASDPRIEEISALTYSLTHRPAPRKNVADLLTQLSVKQITSALTEYVSGIEDRELAYAVKTFFVDGGCAAIITAQKNRHEAVQKKIQKDQQEQNLINSLVDKHRQQSELEDKKLEEQAQAERPSVDDLFGSPE